MTGALRLKVIGGQMAHVEKYKRTAVPLMTEHYDRAGGDFERAAARHVDGLGRHNIDPARSPLNYNLGPDRHESQREWVAERLAGLGRKPRKDAVVMCDWVVTQPLQVPADRSREFFRAVYGFLSERYGEGNVVSAWVHLDEISNQPHMHFAFVPVTSDGRLCAKEILSRAALKGFHGELEGYVAREMGMERAGLTLTEDERRERAGKYVGLAEYQDAREAAREAEEQAAAALERAAELEEMVEETRRELDGARQELAGVRAVIARAAELVDRLVSALEHSRVYEIVEAVAPGLARTVRELARDIGAALTDPREAAEADLGRVRAAAREAPGAPSRHQGRERSRERADGHQEPPQGR